MPSSIFSSKAGFWLAGLLGLAALLGPAEFMIRTIERSFGEKARFTYPANDAQKLDWALDYLAQRQPISTLIVGNSQCEYGVDPAGLEPGSYNLTFSGSSFIAGLKLVRTLDLAPKQIVICISPADLTRDMVARGDQIVATAQAKRGLVGGSSFRDKVTNWRQRLENEVGTGFATVFRCGDTHYRRLLSDFGHLLTRRDAWPDTPEAWGRFWTSGQSRQPQQVDARYYTARFDRGFLGLVMVRPWNGTDFDSGAYLPVVNNYRATVFPDYDQNGNRYWEEAEALVTDLSRSGIRIVLLRMPVAKDFAAIEDEATGFSKHLAAFAAKLVLRSLDGAALAPDMARDVSSYRDAAHLHQQSAQIFTSRLAKVLVQGR